MAGFVFPQRMGYLQSSESPWAMLWGWNFVYFRWNRTEDPGTGAILSAPVTVKPIRVEFWSSHVSGGQTLLGWVDYGRIGYGHSPQSTYALVGARQTDLCSRQLDTSMPGELIQNLSSFLSYVLCAIKSPEILPL